MTTSGPWSEARARCESLTIVSAEAILKDRFYLRAALDAIDAVLALHQRDAYYNVCAHCFDNGKPSESPYPCPTVRALGVTQ